MFKNNIIELIGNTPLLRLNGSNIYAKLEYFNPLHSVKDRAALYMIEGAEARNELKKGGTIIEPTSGNTGIGIAYIAKTKGYNAILVMPENMSKERIALLEHLGARVELTPEELGMQGAIARANELKESIDGAYIPMQFDNRDNVLAHLETTAPEIIKDLGGVIPNYLVLVVGSGGTISGISKALKDVYPELITVAVEPKESPLLSTGVAGAHGIQGIGANFVPSILDKEYIDKIVTVSTEEAYEGARRAAKDYGTLVGISSGAALVASEKLVASEPDAVVVTLFPDSGERYLSVFAK